MHDGVSRLTLLMFTGEIGWIQWYRWSDYPEHVLLLGPDMDCTVIDLAVR